MTLVFDVVVGCVAFVLFFTNEKSDAPLRTIAIYSGIPALLILIVRLLSEQPLVLSFAYASGIFLIVFIACRLFQRYLKHS